MRVEIVIRCNLILQCISRLKYLLDEMNQSEIFWARKYYCFRILRARKVAEVATEIMHKEEANGEWASDRPLA